MTSDPIPEDAEVGPHEQSITFPVMKGRASMAVGADDRFEVPLFTQLTRLLWMGCSPAEFPDEYESQKYNPIMWMPVAEPVQCHWLYEGVDANHPGVPDKPRFDVILNLFPWGDYAYPSGVTVFEVEMYDSAGEPDKEQVDVLAQWVIEHLDDNKRVLVHCQAGLNRSSLVSARVLMLSRAWTADQAITHIRNSRSPMCLCNDTFEKWLRSLA